jgi:hypothetical protein
MAGLVAPIDVFLLQRPPGRECSGQARAPRVPLKPPIALAARRVTSRTMWPS